MHTLTHLSLCSVLIKSSEAGEVGCGNGGSTLGAEHGVGVSGVTHNHNLHGTRLFNECHK